MSSLIVPALDEVPWPSLGPQVCRWIEDNLVHGPGDILGEPAKIDGVTRAIIRRAYEIHPAGSLMEGRRRFQTVALSQRKGTAKTEKAAWLAIAELHPEAPIRFAGWNAHGEPVGNGITDPYIPLLATTEEQSEALTYAAVRVILQESPVGEDFDIALGRILRKDGNGVIEAVTGSPNARDGARTTFEVFDELHRLVDARLKKTYNVMRANLPKRKDADGWALGTTTAFMPGERSVAEETKDYAERIAEGKESDPTLFYFHRQADDGVNLDDEDSVRDAVIEASGVAAEWSNIDGIVSLWRDPTTDRSYFERVWLNRSVMSHSQIFDMTLMRPYIRPLGPPKRRTEITLGFDGSRTTDATALVGTEIESGYQFVLGFWEKPFGLSKEEAEDWEVPGHEVDEIVELAMSEYKVKRFLADRAYWETYVDRWAGKWPKIVVVFPTSALKKTAMSIKDYTTAWRAGEVTIDGDRRLIAHLGNARKRELTLVDEEGQPLYLMEKDSPEKRIDAAYAGMLSWEARAEAIQKGALKRAGSKPGRTTVYTG